MIAWPWDKEKQEENLAEADWIINLLKPGEEPLEPISDIYYPVIVEALENVHHREEDLSSENYSTAPGSNKLGAVLALTIYWRDALRDLLPMGSAGVVVVFENACDVPPFTYEIAGPVPRYLGTGKYNSTFENDDELSRVLNLMDVWEFGIKETAYTGIPINEDVCPFLLRVYPTESSFDQFIDGDDQTVYIVLALVLSVAVLTIAFTLLFFFLYDRLVRNEIRAKINLLDAKRNFVRFVSHEVRTPLNTVSMGLTLIHQDLLSRERRIGNENKIEIKIENGNGNGNEIDSANDENGTFVSKEDFSKWSSLTREVSKNADIAVGVLNDLLNIDKIQMGAFRLEMETLPVWDLIEQTTMEFDMMATKQKTKLNLDLKSLVKSRDIKTAIPTTTSMLPPSVLNKKIVGDPQRIRQVLRNLLSNAIKFSKNQSVTLKVSTRDATTTCNDAKAMKEINLAGGICVGLSMIGWVVVDVIDTGVGMTPLQLQTVFDVGTQFNANKLQSGGGSGLGLAFAKAITEQHGGSLRAHSNGRDKGTTFRLDLPLYHDKTMESTSPNNMNDDANADAIADAALSLSSSIASTKPETTTTATTIREETLEPMHILVVDDALLNRKLLIRLLESNGHSCGEAENGQELIDTIEARCDSSSGEAQAAQYDCILVDYEMPVMNGPDACKAIRKMGYTGFVVGVTGNLLPEDVSYFMHCGADAVLSKPFKYKDLEQLLMEQGIFAV
jgi:signal transduction histidine kinase